MSQSEDIFSDDGEEGRPARGWTRTSNLPILLEAQSMTPEDVRLRYGIRPDIEIYPLNSLTDPIEEDEAAVSLYQLEYGLTLPADYSTCTLLNYWGLPVSQVHPSIFIVMKRLSSIISVYNVPFGLNEAVKLFSPHLLHISNGQEIVFHCGWKYNRFRFKDFPSNYEGWTQPCFKLKNWRRDPRIKVPHARIEKICRNRTPPCDFDTMSRIEALFSLDKTLLNVSFPESYVQWLFDRGVKLGRVMDPFPAIPLTQIPLFSNQDIPISEEDIARIKFIRLKKTAAVSRGASASKRFSEAQSSFKVPPEMSNMPPDMSCGSNFNFVTTDRLDESNTNEEFLKRRRSLNKRKSDAANICNSDVMSRKECKLLRRSTRQRKDTNYAESSLRSAGSPDQGDSVDLCGNLADDASESSESDSDGVSDTTVPSPFELGGVEVTTNKEKVDGNEFSRKENAGASGNNKVRLPHAIVVGLPAGPYRHVQHNNADTTSPVCGDPTGVATHEHDQCENNQPVETHKGLSDVADSPSDNSVSSFEANEKKNQSKTTKKKQYRRLRKSNGKMMKSASLDVDDHNLDVLTNVQNLYKKLGSQLGNLTNTMKKCGSSCCERRKKLMHKINHLEETNSIIIEENDMLKQEVEKRCNELREAYELIQQLLEESACPPS